MTSIPFFLFFFFSFSYRYFNFRSTNYLVENGLYKFANWFDDTAWYPLGRIVGGTVFPGLFSIHTLYILYTLYIIYIHTHIRFNVDCWISI